MNNKGIIELNVKDMLYRLCRSWRSLLACMIAGIILMACLSWMRPIIIVDESTDKTVGSGFQELTDLKDSLSDRELNEVRMTVESYLTFRRLLLNYGARSDSSILLKVNPHRIPTLTRSYVISDYEVENSSPVKEFDDCDNIVEIYLRELRNNVIAEEIRKALGENIDTSSIQEVILVTKNAKSVMDISVYGTDQEQCEKIMSVIDKNLDAITNKAHTIYSFKIDLLNETYSETEDVDLYKRQQEQADYTASLQRNLMALPDKLVEKQKTYYNTAVSVAEELLSEGELSEESILEKLFSPEEQLEEYISEAEEGNAEIHRVIRLKYLLAGAFLGILLASAWILFRYIVSSKLRNTDEIKWVLGCEVLGVVNESAADSNKKLFHSIDSAIDKLFLNEKERLDPDQSIERICNEAYWFAKKSNIGKILVTGSYSNPFIENVTEKICSGIAALNRGKNAEAAGNSMIEAFTTANAISNADEAEKIAEAEGVILVERINGSRFNEIGEELALYKKHGIDIIGTVVVSY